MKAAYLIWFNGNPPERWASADLVGVFDSSERAYIEALDVGGRVIFHDGTTVQRAA